MARKFPDPRVEKQNPETTQQSQVNPIDSTAERSRTTPGRSISDWSASSWIWTTISTRLMMEVTKHDKIVDGAPGITSQKKPFLRTPFGTLAPEIRETIFKHLLAAPPPHAGREVSVPYHLKASHLPVLQTCRLIYIQAFPIFYGHKSYYAANAKELSHILSFSGPDSPLFENFRYERIAMLCVKDLVVHAPSDEEWASNVPAYHTPRFATYAAQIGKDFAQIRLDDRILVAIPNLKHWESLSKLYLCMRAGEELEYLRFLSKIPGLEQGVVKFVDGHRWVARPQVQNVREGTGPYFPFHYFSPDRISDLQILLHIDSHTSGQEAGNELYVELDIVRYAQPSRRLDKCSTEEKLSNARLPLVGFYLSLLAGLAVLAVAIWHYLPIADRQYPF